MKKATIRFPCGRDVRVYVAPGLTVAGLLKQLDLPVHSHGLTLRKRAEPLPYETKLETTVRGSINDTHIFEVVHVRSEVSNALRATPLPFLSPCTASAKESIHADKRKHVDLLWLRFFTYTFTGGTGAGSMVSHQFSSLLRDAEIPIPNHEDHFILFKSVAAPHRSIAFSRFLKLLEKVAVAAKLTKDEVVRLILVKETSSRKLRSLALAAFLESAIVTRCLHAFREAFSLIFLFFADASGGESQTIVDASAHGKHVAHVTPRGALDFFTSMRLSSLSLSKVDVLESFLQCATVHKIKNYGRHAVLFLDDFTSFVCLVALVAGSRRNGESEANTDEEMIASLLRHMSSKLQPQEVKRILQSRPKATSGTRLLILRAAKSFQQAYSKLNGVLNPCVPALFERFGTVPNLEGLGSQALNSFRARIAKKRKHSFDDYDGEEKMQMSDMSSKITTKTASSVAQRIGPTQKAALDRRLKPRTIRALRDNLRQAVVRRDFMEALANENVAALAAVQDSLTDLVDFLAPSFDHFEFGSSMLDLARSFYYVHATWHATRARGGQQKAGDEGTGKTQFPTVEPLIGAEVDVVGELVLFLLNTARDNFAAAREEPNGDSMVAAAKHGLACALVEIEFCRLRYVPNLEIEIDDLELGEIASNINCSVELFKAAGDLRKASGTFASTTNIAFAHFVHFEALKRNGAGVEELVDILVQAESYNKDPTIRDFLAAKLFECRLFCPRRRQNGSWTAAFRKVAPYGEEHLRKAYVLLDQDHDGFLDYDDITGLIRIPVEDFYSMTRTCETSTEGSLNFFGFCQFLSLLVTSNLLSTFLAFKKLKLPLTSEVYDALASGRPRASPTEDPERHFKLSIADNATSITKQRQRSAGERASRITGAALQQIWRTRLLDYYVCMGRGPILEHIDSGNSKSPLDLEFEPILLDRFPLQNHVDMDFPKELPKFCFPLGMRLRMQPTDPTFHEFVLTDISGTNLYAVAVHFYEELSDFETISMFSVGLDKDFARPVAFPEWVSRGKGATKVYSPKCITLLSHWPFTRPFRMMLAGLLGISKVLLRNGTTPALEPFVCNIMLEIPLVAQGPTHVVCRSFGKNIIFRRPSCNRVDVSNIDMVALFQNISIPNIVDLFSHLMNEGSVVIISKHLSLLTPVCLALRALLWPFKWSGVFLPLLPKALNFFIQAPVPFVAGVHRSCFEGNDMVDGVCYLDLDRDNLDIDNDQDDQEGWQIPAHLARKLTRDLRGIAHAFEDALQISESARARSDLLDLDGFQVQNLIREGEKFLPTIEKLPRSNAFCAHVRNAFARVNVALFGHFDREKYVEQPTAAKRTFLEVCDGRDLAFCRRVIESQQFAQWLTSSDGAEEKTIFDKCRDEMDREKSTAAFLRSKKMFSCFQHDEDGREGMMYVAATPDFLHVADNSIYGGKFPRLREKVLSNIVTFRPTQLVSCRRLRKTTSSNEDHGSISKRKAAIPSLSTSSIISVETSSANTAVSAIESAEALASLLSTVAPKNEISAVTSITIIHDIIYDIVDDAVFRGMFARDVEQKAELSILRSKVKRLQQELWLHTGLSPKEK